MTEATQYATKEYVDGEFKRIADVQENFRMKVEAFRQLGGQAYEQIPAIREEITRLIVQGGELRRGQEQLASVQKQHTEILGGHTKKLDEHTEILGGHTKKLDEHTEILGGHSKKLDEHTEILGGHTRKLEEHDRRFDGLDSKLDELDSKLDKVLDRLPPKPAA